jgi:hypothetical protein
MKGSEMHMPSFPDNWRPAILMDDQEIRQVIALYEHTLYKWLDNGPDFEWMVVDEERLQRVREYLVKWEGHSYWQVILLDDVRGYSLFLHEWVELEAFKGAGKDSMDLDQQVENYRPMHAEALLVEHCFLQAVASAMGYSFTLRELIEYNPHGDPPDDGWEGDWEVLIEQMPQRLSRGDRKFDRARESSIREFYRQLGFERVRHDAEGD